MEGPARVTAEPGDHFGLLVNGIVVEDDVDQLARGNRRLDGVEKADELLMQIPTKPAGDSDLKPATVPT